MFLDTQPAPLPAEGGRDAWQEFRVAHPGEILAYLRQLRDGAVPVQLSSPDAHALSVSTRHTDCTCAAWRSSMCAAHVCTVAGAWK